MSQSKLASALKTYSVLPDNYSPLERALELSFNQQFANIEHPYPNLLDAFSSSMDVVPAIAAERLVPIWDVSDSDEVKRNLAGNAWQIRKLAGTREGLKLALDSLGFIGEIKLWHQTNSEPYSFEVLAWAKGNAEVDPKSLSKLLAYVDDIKSERDNYHVALTFGLESPFIFSGALDRSVSIFDDDLLGELAPVLELPISVYLAGTSHQLQISEFSPLGEIDNNVTCFGPLAMAGVSQMCVITDFTVGAKI